MLFLLRGFKITSKNQHFQNGCGLFYFEEALLLILSWKSYDLHCLVMQSIELKVIRAARSGYRAFLIGLAEAFTECCQRVVAFRCVSQRLCNFCGFHQEALFPADKTEYVSCSESSSKTVKCKWPLWPSHPANYSGSIPKQVLPCWLAAGQRGQGQLPSIESNSETLGPPSLPKWLNVWFHSGCQGIVMAKKREDFRRILELSRLSRWKYWILNCERVRTSEWLNQAEL